MDNIIELDVIDLAFALVLMGMAIALLAWQKIGLEGQMALAAIRSLIQLAIIGYIIAFVFAVDNPFLILGILGIMLMIATLVARNRISKKRSRLLPIVGGSLLASTAFTLAYILLIIIQPPVWYDPQYLIPLTGMVLGNAMNSSALAGERLFSTINSSRLEIETHLSLGATPKQAVFTYRRDAIRASLIPTLNQMMVAGLVTLPGMFTGQVLSGVDPLNAASYQILILYAIAFTNLVTSLLVTEGVYRQFFNQNEQFIL